MIIFMQTDKPETACKKFRGKVYSADAFYLADALSLQLVVT